MQDNVTQAGWAEEKAAFAKMLKDARWPDLDDGHAEYDLACRAWNAGQAFASTTAQSEAVQKLVDALEKISAEKSETFAYQQVGYADGFHAAEKSMKKQIRQALAAHRESQP